MKSTKVKKKGGPCLLRQGKRKMKKKLIITGLIWLPLIMIGLYGIARWYIEVNGGYMHLSLYGHGCILGTALLGCAGIGLKNAIDYIYYGKREFSSVREYMFTKRYSRERKLAMFPPIRSELLYREPTGIVLGCVGLWIFKRYVCIDVNNPQISNHIAILGNSGSGKSSLMLSNLIRQFQERSSNKNICYLVLDVKPELYDKSVSDETAVRAIKPLERDGWGWDVYWNISKNSTEDEIYSAFKAIASVLVPEGEEKNRFFTNNARNILCALLMYDFMQYEYSFGQSIRRILEEPLAEKINELKKRLNEKSKVYMLLAEFGNNDKSNAWEDIKKTVISELDLFVKNNVEWLLDSKLNKRMCSPRDLEEGTSLFLIIPRGYLKEYSTLFRLIISQCMEYLSLREDDDPSKAQVIFLIDELPNLEAKIPSYTSNLGYIRSKKVTCVSIIQQYSKLQNVYGKEDAKTIVNMGHQLILSCEDNELGRMFSDKGGEFEETKVEYKRTGGIIKRRVGNESISKVVSKRIRVMNDIASLVPRFEAIAFINGSEYLRFRKVRYYLDKKMKARAKECMEINRIKNEGYVQEDEDGIRRI